MKKHFLLFLFQNERLPVIFHSEIKKEENAFSINDVIMSINNKMIRRNPHVFDNKDNKKFTIDEIDKNWKKIKQEEKL